MSLYLGENLISGQATLVGESRNIGQIIPSAIPLTDAELHLLDGSLIQGSGIYSAFVTYIAGLVSTYPNLFVSESAWQSAVSSKGICDKFVYDSTNNTVRLPKYGTQIITKTSTTSSTVPTTITASGNMKFKPSSSSSAVYTPYFNSGANEYVRIQAGSNTSGNLYYNGGLKADTNTSSLLTQYPLDCYYYIVIATSTKTDIEVDIDNVVSDLNGKADRDLLNVSDTGNIQMAGASMPSDTYINLTLNASGSTYTAPADGFVILRTNARSSSTFAFSQLGIANINLENTASATASNWSASTFIPVRKGQSFYALYGTTVSEYTKFRFIYAVGSESEAS